MKKIAVITLATLAMVFSLVPSSVAFAAKDSGYGRLNIRNRTGGIVTLVLFDANGNRHNYTFEDGQSFETLPQGYYDYYISTICGNQAGAFGLNGIKQLYFSCHGGLEFEASNPNSRNTSPELDTTPPDTTPPGTTPPDEPPDEEGGEE